MPRGIPNASRYRIINLCVGKVSEAFTFKRDATRMVLNNMGDPKDCILVEEKATFHTREVSLARIK